MNPNYGYQLYQIQRIKTRAEVLADDALFHRSCCQAASVVVTVRVWSAKLATSSKCPPSART